MSWINRLFSFLIRRFYRIFLSFLPLILLFITNSNSLAQQVPAGPNSDSLEYYLQIVDDGERQVGRALARIGELYFESGRYNSAINYLDQALPLLNGERKSLEIGKIYQLKGQIFEIFGDNAEPRRYYRLAEIQYTRSLAIFDSIDHPSGRMQAYRKLAVISAKRNNYASAVVYQDRVIEAITKLYQDSLQLQAESFNQLLNQEIQSSKDTIFIQPPDRGNGRSSLPWWDWRYLLILLLLLGMIWISRLYFKVIEQMDQQQRRIQQYGTEQQKLKAEINELQSINLVLTRTEKEQRQLNQTKDKIFSIISHDLRSPINTILGFLNILSIKLRSLGDIELKNLAQEMEETTVRLSVFLDDLLKWSMSQMGRLEANPEFLDLKAMVQENYKLVEPRVKKKHINFRTNINEKVKIYADRNMLMLVLRNLISNAIKFTKPGGYIAVSLKVEEPNKAAIYVADDGIGMNDEDLQKIFDFEASNINGTPENKGAGLGLVLCKEFVERNGGNILVESKLGHGTRFKIILPAEATN